MNTSDARILEPSRIYILPCLFTAGNLLFGFLSIIRCIQARYIASSEALSMEYYTQAVWCILLAFACDALDGLVARISSQNSLFGKELDSLADIVSFGVAPAMMMFLLLLSPTENFPFFRQVGWLVGFIYLLCAAVRLARFNVITHPLVLEKAGKRPHTGGFIGLPTPAAAGLISSIVLIMAQLNNRFIWLGMPALMLLVALLMVSNIRYTSFRNINSKTHVPFKVFVAILSLAVVMLLCKEFAFALLFLGYIFYGLFRHIWAIIKLKYRRDRA